VPQIIVPDRAVEAADDPAIRDALVTAERGAFWDTPSFWASGWLSQP